MSNTPDHFRTLAIDASRADVTRPTGVEWYSREIINALARLQHRPQLVLYRRRNISGRLGRCVNSRPVRLPRMWTHVGLSTAMMRDRPDALFVPSHVLPAFHPATSVVTVHDLGYVVEPESHPRNRHLMLSATTRWNVKAATRVIAISNQTKQDLVNFYGADEHKIDVVHHGLNHRKFRKMDRAEIVKVLSRLNIDSPYILFLSTIQPRKNIARLIDAFSLLDRGDLKLVVAGQTGWLGDDIERLIASHGFRGGVQRLGYVDAADLPALYAGAELFAFPSLYEGFGMGILEAMACGCPVVTSNLSSMPEISGNAAVLVDPHDTRSIAVGIERALQADIRQDLITKGFIRASQFSWKKAAEKTLASIHQAFNDTNS